MKWIYRLFTFVLIGGAMAFPFFMDNKSGKPMLSLPEPKDFIPSSLTSGQAPVSLPSSSQTFYKWQDKQGTWHYGDTPPVNGSNFSTVEIDSNTNVIQSIPIEEDSEQPNLTNTPNTQKQKDTPVSDVLSFERALNVLNDAKEVQGLMNDRNAQLEAMDK